MKISNFDPIEKVWSGPTQNSIYNENLSVGQLILEVLKLTPERITQIFADNGSEMSCYEMRSRTIKIAHYLMQKGYKQHDIVGIMCANSENLAPIVIACLTLGMPINTLATVMIESDIIQMYSKTKPKLIFCDVDVVEKMKKSTENMNLNAEIITLRERCEGFLFVDDLLQCDLDPQNFKFPKLVDIANSTAIILCSSGSTGSPKGVCKSHKQLILHLINPWNDDFKSNEVIFNFSSLYWETGWIVFITGTLYGATRVITTNTFSPEIFMKIVKTYRVTTIFSAPFIMSQFINFEADLNEKVLESLKIVMLGGSFVSKGLCKSLEKFMPNALLCPTYGASEVDFITGNYDGLTKFGSTGKLFPNVQVKICNEDGEKLDVNQVGEICIKVPKRFLQYFDEPEKTHEATYDDWFHSGDMGYFDEDEFLFISGRKKEILKYNNFQVSPLDIEEIIESLEDVEQSCVVGVLNEKTGNDLIVAFVKKKLNSNLTEDEILSFVDSKVIDAKRLRGGVHFVDSFPLTPSAKIKKMEMKKIAENMKL